MQIDINSRKQLNKPENYAVFYSLLNRLPTSDRGCFEGKRSFPVHGRTYHESARHDTEGIQCGHSRGCVSWCRPLTRKNSGRFSVRSVPRYCTRCSCWASIRPTGTRVNAFCLDSRIAGMEFRELDCEALDTLQVKLRAIRRKRENKQQLITI